MTITDAERNRIIELLCPAGRSPLRLAGTATPFGRSHGSKAMSGVNPTKSAPVPLSRKGQALLWAVQRPQLSKPHCRHGLLTSRCSWKRWPARSEASANPWSTVWS